MLGLLIFDQTVSQPPQSLASCGRCATVFVWKQHFHGLPSRSILLHLSRTQWMVSVPTHYNPTHKQVQQDDGAVQYIWQGRSGQVLSKEACVLLSVSALARLISSSRFQKIACSICTVGSFACGLLAASFFSSLCWSSSLRGCEHVLS